MSREIDEAVVRMEFDNGQFERNVQESLGTLDKLKKALNLDKSSQSLKELDRVGNGLHLGSVEKQIGMIAHRMSALGQISAGVWNRIASDAVACGKRVANAFTVQPVKDGFSEYELKMNSVQTIMASTGEDIKTVNRYLEELNTYADKTIYSFSDMTASIGKFTNAGVKLDDAVAAIKGISNEAAVSGANANEASRAMYNFAQALSAGYVKLIDWKSIENANMATQEFKKQLIDTAVELGTLKKKGDAYVTTTTNLRGKTSDAFTSTKMFNESLEYQWMTTDVLTKTLGKYSDETTKIGKKAYAAAQDVKTFSQLMDTLKEAAGSGWAQSFEHVFGDLEEAKQLWTSASQVLGGLIDKFSDARNSLLKGWKDAGGRNDLLKGMENLYKGLTSIIKPLGIGFRNVFPAATVKNLLDATKKFKEFTATLKLNREQQENLRHAMIGLMMPIKIVKTLIGDTFSIIKTIGPPIFNAFMKFLGVIGDAMVEFEYYFQLVRVTIQYTLEYFNIVENVGTLVNTLFGFMGNAITAVFNGIAGLLGFIASMFGYVIEPAATVGDVIYTIAMMIATVLDDFVVPAAIKVFKTLSKVGKQFDKWGKKLNLLKKLQKLGQGIAKLFGSIGKSASPFFSKFGNWLKDIGGRAIDFVIEKIDRLIELVNNFDGIKLPEINFGAWFNDLKSNLQNGIKSFTGFSDSVKKENKSLNSNLKIKKMGFDFSGVYTGLSSVLSFVGKNIQNVIAKSKSLSGIFSTITNSLKGFKLPGLDFGFGNATQNLVQLNAGVKETTKSFDLMGTVVRVLTAPINAITTGFKALLASMKPVDEQTEESGQGFNALVEAFRTIGEVAATAGQGLMNFAAGLDVSKLAAFAFVTTTLTMVLGILKLMNSIDYTVRAFGGAAASSSKLIDALKDIAVSFGETYAPVKKSKMAIKEFAISITMLTGCMKLLADIPSKDLQKAGMAIAQTMALLVGFTFLVNLMKPTEVTAAVIGTILPLALGISVLAGAIALLNQIEMPKKDPWKHLLYVLTELAVCVTLMGALAIALAKWAPALSTGMIGLLVIAFSINQIAKTLSTLGEIDTSQVKSKITDFMGITVVLGALAITLGRIPKLKSAAAMAIILLALKLSIPMLKEISKIKFTAVEKALKKYIVVIGLVSAVAMALSMLDSFKGHGKFGENMKNVGIGFAAMAASVLILAEGCKAFGRLKENELRKGLKALIVMGAIFAALEAIALFSKGQAIKGIASVFFGFAAAVTALVGAVYILGNIDMSVIKRGLVAVAGLAGILAVATMIANIGSATADFKAILALVGGLVALGGMLLVLSYTPWKILENGIKAMLVCMVTLSTVIFATGKATAGATGLQIGVLAMATASLIALAVSLYRLAEQPWEKIAAAGAAISAAMVAFGAMCSMVNVAGLNAVGLIGSAVLMIEGLAAVWALSEILIQMAPYSNGMIEAAGSIAIAMLAMAAVCDICVFAGSAAPAAIAGIGALDVLIVSLLGIIELFGWLNEEVTGGEMTEWFTSFGEMIGGLVGGLVNAGLDEASKSLPEVGERIKTFMQHMQYVAMILADENSDFSKLAGVFEALGNMAKYSYGFDEFGDEEGFTNFANSIQKLFETSIPAIREAVKDLDDSVVDKVELAGDILKAISEAAKAVPNEGGALGAIVGNNDLGFFAITLGKMFQEGGGFQKLIEGTKGLSRDAVSQVEIAGEILTAISEAGQNIPNTGGALGKIVGNNDIGKFGEMLGTMFEEGGGFRKLLSSTEGLTKDSVGKVGLAASMVSEMATAAKDIPNTGGALAWWIGDNNLSTFANEIAKAMPKLKEAAKAAGNAGDLSKLSVISDVMSKMSAVANVHPNEMNISNLTVLANAISEFVRGGLTTAVHDLQELGDISGLEDTAATINKFVVTCSGDIPSENMQTLGSDLVTFSKKLVTFSTNLKQVETGNVPNVIAMLNKIKNSAASFEGVDLGSISGFMKQVKGVAKGSGKGVAEAATESVDAALSKLKSKAKNFNTVGKNLINQMINGMKSRGSAVQNAGKSIAEKGAQGAKNERSGFVDAGRYCIQGLAEGLANSGAVQSAINAARNAVRKAVQAAKDEADEASPSKKFIKIGGYMSEGLSVGLEDKSNLRRITKASVNMAKMSWTSFNDYLGIHSPSKKFSWSAGNAFKGFVGGLQKRWKGVKRSGRNFANSFFGSFNNPMKSLMDTAGKSAGSNFSNSFGNALSDGVAKGTKGLGKTAGGAGSSAGAAAGAAAGKAVEKFTKKDSKKAALLYASIFQKTLIDYDPFNKKFLKNKKISVPYDTSKINIKEVGLKYVNASIKSTALRSAMDILGSEVVKRINKKIVKEVKNNGKGALSNARIKQITKNALKDISYAYNEMNLIMAQFDKKTRKAIKAVPEAVAAYVKNYKSVASFDKGLIKTVKKQFGSDMKETRGKLNSLISTYDDGLRRLRRQKKEWDKVLDDKKSTKKQKKQAEEQIKILSAQINKLTKQRKKLVSKKKLAGGATTMLDTFAQQLYYNSSEFKTTKKNLTKNIKDLEKIQKKADKAMAIVQDPKKSAKQKKEALKNLESYAKESKKLKKSISKDTKALAEGPGKALKKFKNELKKVYKEYLKLSNVKLAEPIISGYTWEASEKAANSYNDALSKTVEVTAEVSGSVEASAEAFDILSASMGSSINLFELFTKTGTADTKALFENAQSQLEAYQEFYEGLDSLKEKGFDQSLIDSLEEQGVDSINYLRGFKNMTAEQVKQYNQVLEQKSGYENKALSRSLERQLRQYEDWMAQVNTLIENKALPQETLNVLVTKIKSAGYNAAYEFVKAFNLMGESDQLRLGEIYSKSISEDLVNFGQEASATVQSWEKDSFSSYLEALEAQVEKDKHWDQMLSDLAAKGYSKDVIDQFKEAGYDSAHAMVESALAETKDGVKRINEIFAEVADDPFQNAIDNRKKQNDAYDEYKNNQDLVKGNIKFLRDMAKYPKEVRALYEESYAGISEIDDLDAFADRYQKVFDNIVSLGYSEADALKYLMGATTKQIEAMYIEINRSDSINKKNREEQFMKEWEQRRDNLVHYQNLYKRVQSHTTDMDPKARERLMAEIKSMGVDDAIAYMETFQYAWQHDTKGWTKFQETYADNAKLADDTADSIISSYSAVFTKAAEVLESSLSSAAKKAAKLTGEQLDKILSKTEMLRKSGEYTKALGDGMTGQLKTVKDASISVAKATVSPFKSRLKAEKGKNLATQYASGISTGISEAKSGVKTDATKLGKGIVNGTKEGITDNEEKVVKAVRKMAKNALQAGCEELGVNSPSKEFMEIGRYVDEGFAMGLEEHSGMAVESMSSLAKLVLQEGMLAAQMINQSLASGIDVEDIQLQSMQDAINRIMEFVDGDLDTSPVITPVIDLDSVRKQAEEMNGLFGDMSAHVNAALYPQNQNGQSNTNNGMTFIQNNYSPEALDRLEIYRQTRNQFAQARNLIGGR